MIFEQDFKIGLDDLNSNRELKNVSILKFLEDIAGFHSDFVKMGINEIYSTGIAWALLDWEVKVLRRPKYGEELHIKTWSRLLKKCHAYRDFEIYVGGERCVIATTKWMLMDLKRRWPALIKPEVAAKYEPEPDRNVLGNEEFARQVEFDNYGYAADYKVRRSDIDINGHVHNTNYLKIVEEALREEETAEIDYFHINYKKEIRYGDTVKIYRKDVSVSGTENDTASAKNIAKTSFLMKSEDDTEVHAMVEFFLR